MVTDEQLERFKQFLDYFNIDYTKDPIELHDGCNSVVLNPKSEWKDFLGYSIAGVAELVAEKLGKETIYID